eukprot:SAG31_NODE_4569_length_3128_cov_53.221525_1_plen_224_part_00
MDGTGRGRCPGSLSHSNVHSIDMRCRFGALVGRSLDAGSASVQRCTPSGCCGASFGWCRLVWRRPGVRLASALGALSMRAAVAHVSLLRTLAGRWPGAGPPSDERWSVQRCSLARYRAPCTGSRLRSCRALDWRRSGGGPALNCHSCVPTALGRWPDGGRALGGRQTGERASERVEVGWERLEGGALLELEFAPRVAAGAAGRTAFRRAHDEMFGYSGSARPY